MSSRTVSNARGDWLILKGWHVTHMKANAIHSFADDAKSNRQQSDDGWFSTKHQWLAINANQGLGVRWRQEIKGKKNYADMLTAVVRCLHYFIFFLSCFSNGSERAFLEDIRKVCGSTTSIVGSHTARPLTRAAGDHHMAETSAVGVQRLKMNSENTAQWKSLFEGCSLIY